MWRGLGDRGEAHRGSGNEWVGGLRSRGSEGGLTGMVDSGGRGIGE